MFFRGAAKYKKDIFKNIGEGLADAILDILEPSNIKREMISMGFSDVGEREFKRELLPLLLYLSTFAFRQIFHNQDDGVFVDSLYGHLVERMFDMPTEIEKARAMNNLRLQRYEQFNDLLFPDRTIADIDFFIEQVPYTFFANLLNKDLNYIYKDKDFTEKYGKSFIQFKIWVRGAYNVFIETFQKAKLKGNL